MQIKLVAQQQVARRLLHLDAFGLQQVAIAEQFDIAFQHAAQSALRGIRRGQDQLQAERTQVVDGGAGVLRVDLVAEFVEQDQADATGPRLALAVGGRQRGISLLCPYAVPTWVS